MTKFDQHDNLHGSQWILKVASGSTLDWKSQNASETLAQIRRLERGKGANSIKRWYGVEEWPIQPECHSVLNIYLLLGWSDYDVCYWWYEDDFKEEGAKDERLLW